MDKKVNEKKRNQYSPNEIEKRWYSFWMENGIFKPSGGEQSFSMVVPPPNVTGILHMGHVLNCSIQDALVRYMRMKGDSVLWIPGLDHAGIATENKVEESLRKEGKSKRDFTREEFISKVWDWKEKHGEIIFSQFEKLGLSLDWDRKKFTMDPDIQKAVRECFVRLYEEDLIYKGAYMVNWSPMGQTALSDDEVNMVEKNQELVEVAYPLEDGSGEIIIATTRAETIPADTGIAVNPNDIRYSGLIGKKAIVPLVDRPIPIVADDEVKMDFGTGALKLTPAHSFVDFEIGKRHSLEQINVLNKEGKFSFDMKYDGLDRTQARKAILEDLDNLGLLRGRENIVSNVGTCYRTGDVIEPRISEQWFVRMKPLAQKAIKAVEDGTIDIKPLKWKKVYFHWLNNIKDWCISRQIWWGHSIPEYSKGGENIVSREDLTKEGYIASKEVLDTWFSSWLWPFAVMGWPNMDKEMMEKFYPTSLVVTGGDIIFFWVARMIMASYQLLDLEPFREVLFHGIVRDEKGRKMSKSLGNSPNPIDIMEKYGADSLRFAMLYNNNLGEDLFYSEEWLEMSKNLCNKIWNVNNFISLRDYSSKIKSEDIRPMVLFDEWMLSRLHSSIKKIKKFMDERNISFAAKEVYNLFWKDFCDKYLEMEKLSNGSPDVLLHIFGEILKLFHPFIPFLTEEMWQGLNIPKVENSISLEMFPLTKEESIDVALEDEFEIYFELIRIIRNMRVGMGIPNSSKLPAAVFFKSLPKNWERFKELLIKQCNVLLTAKDNSDSYAKATKDFEVYFQLDGLIDIEREIEKMEREIEKISNEYQSIKAKLNNFQFLEKAPPKIIQKNREIEKELLDKIKVLNEGISKFKK